MSKKEILAGAILIFLLILTLIVGIYVSTLIIKKNNIDLSKPIVYLKEPKNKRLNDYERGFKAGYEEAIKDMEEQKFLDGGEE